MLDKIPDNIKSPLTAFGPLIAVFFLSYLVGTFGFSKISGVRRDIKKAQNDQVVLNQKLSVLRNVTSEIVTGATAVALALPDSNPSVIVLSQVKSISSDNGVTVGNIKSGGEVSDPSGLSRVDVGFDITGDRRAVVNAILQLPTYAPLMVLDKVKLNETGGIARASISVKSFWSPLPTQLPALTEKINDLSDKERELLGEITALIPPAFTGVTAAEGGKPDPFIP